MAGRISMATRSELVAAIVERYRLGSRSDKCRILDEFVAVTGYHRKHAIRVLAGREKRRSGNKSNSLRHGSNVREALIVLCETSERLCSKRLKPLIPVLLPALERHGRLELDDALRSKLMAVSPATMDRLLTEVRMVARRGQRRRAGMSSAVRRSVPVRTFGMERSAARLRRGRFCGAFRHVFVRQLCADDGADRYRHRLDRIVFRSARGTAAM